MGQNQMHGKGIFTWTNGRQYMGEYRHDQKEGYGWFKWPDSSQYEGEWKDGKQHGSGTYLSAVGEKTSGQWEGGRRVEDASGTAVPQAEREASRIGSGTPGNSARAQASGELAQPGQA